MLSFDRSTSMASFDGPEHSSTELLQNLSTDLQRQLVCDEPVVVETKGTSSCVQVAVRIRPFVPSEAGHSQCVESFSSAVKSKQPLNYPDSVRIGGEHGPCFSFDFVFSPSSTQREVFTSAVMPLVEACLEGYNATILAYGQTGSGKTFTVLGPNSATCLDQESSNVNYSGKESEAGIIPRVVRDLFQRLEKSKILNDDKSVASTSGFEYEVRLQFLELYGEEIRDLLAPASSSKLTIRDGGPNVEPEVIGASEVRVNSADEAILFLARGALRRVTGATAMNTESSRSHAIMTLVVEQTFLLQSSIISIQGDEYRDNVETETKRSKFHFVDLAGSERQKRSLASGTRLKEGININKGLLVLGNVISALGDPRKRGKVFVPYRDSKLTRLLKGSLGGNHKTLMIACVSPSSSNLEESLNCLRYANRAKNIQNNAVINTDSGSQIVFALQSQLRALALELLKLRASVPLDLPSQFSNDYLISLVKGKNPPISFDSPAYCTEIPSGTLNVSQSSGVEVTRTLEEANTEIERLHKKLKLSGDQYFSVSQELLLARAGKEYFKLQFASDNSIPDSDHAHPNNAYLEKIIAYETEISQLKRQLDEVTHYYSSPEAHDCFEARDDCLDGQAMIGKTFQKPNQEQGGSRSTEMSEQPSNLIRNQGVEGEIDAEHAQLSLITEKYLNMTGANEFTYDEGTVNNDSPMNESTSQTQQCDDESDFAARQHVIDKHLSELSDSITSKEALIEQLENSQQLYEAMRIQYETKLSDLETQLQILETEREQLISSLKTEDINSDLFTNLKDKLKDKENQIAALKRRQKELCNLTKSSAHDSTVLSSLQKDVESLKRQKNSLHRQLAHEHNSHLQEISKLKREAASHEKYAMRCKIDLSRVLKEKENSDRLAKMRSDEVSRLRLKYRDAEKRKRMLTLKKGVMDRVGIDQVLLGHKSTQRINGLKLNKADADVDGIRDFLDTKVAEISKKEASADKLAHEWEDHLTLTDRRDELIKISGDNKEDFQDQLDALNIQISFKEERIRALARRLGERPKSLPSGDNAFDFILKDVLFTELCGILSPQESCKLAAKILFGMLVRERRRVATLARTASALDQKVIETGKWATAQEAALRSQLEEEKMQKISMARRQHEQISSLMALAQQDEINESNNAALLTSSDSMIIRLANERIVALETQLSEIQSGADNDRKNKEVEKQALKELDRAEEECASLKQEVNKLKSALRHIRSTLSSERASSKVVGDIDENDTSGCKKDQKVSKIIEDALTSTFDHNISDRPSELERQVSIIMASHGNDDDVFDGVYPEWAGDIMKDLAIIAAGEPPPSLKDVQMPQFIDSSQRAEPKNIEQRSRSPTGVQRKMNAFPGTKSRDGTPKRTPPRPDSSSVSSQGKRSVVTASDKQMAYRSVFERLQSPTNYTGTQKTVHEELRRRLQEAMNERNHLVDNEKAAATPSKFFDSYMEHEVFKRLQQNETKSYSYARKAAFEESSI